MNKAQVIENIESFERQYNYDSGYIKEILDASEKGYQAYEGFLPMAHFINKCPADAYFVAKLVTMKTEDCGPCLQLNVTMAKEAGVDPEVIKAALGNGDDLKGELKMVFDYTQGVLYNNDQGAREQVLEHYGKEILVELSIGIASARIFPTLKKAIKGNTFCSVPDLEV
jgi:hypothetical protein